MFWKELSLGCLFLEKQASEVLLMGQLPTQLMALHWLGPIPGKHNAYCIIGLRAGLGEGGGHGWLLAQQIVHGEACYDTWCIDPRRFTAHTNVEMTSLKAIEDYQNEFRFHFPHEHRPAGRPAKTTSLTDSFSS